MKLSVIIPAYNERQTLPQVIPLVLQALPDVPKEIVIVDDNSTDGTREWLLETFSTEPQTITLTAERSFATVTSHPEEKVTATLRAVFHRRNQGKGAALRTGFQNATGDIFVIQDADLEYDPQDWEEMWRLIAENRADVVYGSRFYGKPHRVLYFHHLLGNLVISNLINLLLNMTLTDIEVCYKMFRREVLEGMKLRCNDFGFEVEFTMKAIKVRRWRLYELGICYYGRTYAEGKKINWRDGVKALWYIFRFWLTD